MDYITFPTTRNELRTIAKVVRKLFGYDSSLYFNVLEAFEKASNVFPFLITTIVEDEELPVYVPARCIPDSNGKYIIEVKNSIYEGAANGINGYGSHILHEICHGILCTMGYAPLLNRTFKNKELKPYESMEWQAKALCGEIQIPYEDTAGMSISQIQEYCKVSYDCAKFRVNEFGKYNSKKIV